MARRTTKHEPEVRLGNLTLARKQGRQRFVNTAARIPPEPLTRRELEALGEEAFDDDNRQRREWHADLGPIKDTTAGCTTRGFLRTGEGRTLLRPRASVMSALRAFPLRTASRPDEALDSWLEATAVRLRVTMAELYEAMGFARPHSELWRHIVLRPTDTELAAISITTGLALSTCGQ